jgi:hypothetical protein
MQHLHYWVASDLLDSVPCFVYEASQQMASLSLSELNHCPSSAWHECRPFDLLLLAALSHARSMAELGRGRGGGEIFLSEGSTGKEHNNKFKEKT